MNKIIFLVFFTLAMSCGTSFLFANDPQKIDAFLAKATPGLKQSLMPKLEEGYLRDLTAAELNYVVFNFRLLVQCDWITSLTLREGLSIVDPLFISNLQNLTYLDISQNELSKIPDFVYLLPKLKTLKAVNNNIREIPEKLREKSSLQLVDLRGNLIDSGNEKIGGLSIYVENEAPAMIGGGHTRQNGCEIV